ncbi:uncharacterized protein LOC6558739 [Drosophila grimshawi]|uniref:GH15908 n=1 Tax=Drosophila grimshawi TaxID=7222 RepID=B4J0Y8_DROGR|nr:uncharacterized protein LOC6558739 [Drosophila grimshawi]EDV95809.1 GH15908 [Drosophila grimshawi]
MAEVDDTKLDADQSQQVAASEKPESNNVEEAEKKAGASESKHEEKNISCNDADPKVDKLDELSSLEQEIAKMHNIGHTTESGLDDDDADGDEEKQKQETSAADQENSATASKSENGNGSGNNAFQHIDELAKTKRCTPVIKEVKEKPETTAALEDVDLIALLKGTDQDQHESKPALGKASIELALAELDNVGVTIEGEGQYEIMEIDDGENASGPSPIAAAAASSPTTSTNTGSKLGKQKLSPEQARAVALKQMADLKAQKARRTTSNVKQQQSQPLDIISSLNDDWNEYDSGSDNASNSNTKSNQNAIASSPPATKKLPPSSSLIKKSKNAIEVPQMIGSVKVTLKSTSVKPVEKAKTTADQSVPILSNSNAEATGFKRTRVIKRKIIWDPDVPETQKSFAQYASSKVAATTNTNAITTGNAAATTTTTATCVVLASKKVRPSTPRDPQSSKVTAAKRAATPSKLSESNISGGSPPKRRSQTPNVVANGGSSTSLAKKKKVSEIDRLMGDEGAANMMQAVEREKRELSGGETANKPLMRKRTLSVTVRPLKAAAGVATAAGTTTVVDVTPTAAPKKESPPKAGSKRASTTNAVDAVFATKAAKQRPSDSWDYVYKQRASEESMIMRRRSNSSYSSNASVNRLSLDNKPAAVSDDASDSADHPTFKFLKPETKANQRSDGDAPQTLANDLKQQATKEPKSVKLELVTLHKLDKVMQLIIHVQLSKTGYTYKMQLLQKLTETLNKLAKSNDCNTVLLSVQGQHFCQGIDCQELLAATLEKRKNNATQLALVLKTYLRTLATFPKPIVAGIVGNLKNLGVMQLPLLDYVVAADDCCFETNYAKLGQLPEGYALWQTHQKVASQVQSRLFLLGERLHTSDLIAYPSSFIDMTCKSRSVNDEALAAANLISSTTAEHYRSLKKLNHSANSALLQRLEAEFKIIMEQWSSANFQASNKRYVNDISQ